MLFQLCFSTQLINPCCFDMCIYFLCSVKNKQTKKTALNFKPPLPLIRSDFRVKVHFALLPQDIFNIPDFQYSWSLMSLLGEGGCQSSIVKINSLFYALTWDRQCILQKNKTALFAHNNTLIVIHLQPVLTPNVSNTTLQSMTLWRRL